METENDSRSSAGEPGRDTAEFGGQIGRTISESQPWWPSPAHPGEHAPNVVIVLLDDTGFAQLGCYGSDIATPTIDALAAGGLQFTDFHVTPLCSARATRASASSASRAPA